MTILKILEEDNYLFLDTLILFLLVNYSPQIMLIYVGMSFLGTIFYALARNRGIPMIPFESRKDNRIQAVMIALVALGIFSYLYNLIHTIQFPAAIVGLTGGGITAAIPTFTEFIMKAFATAPVLEQSRIIQFFVFGLLIPIVETKFFFRTLMGWFSWKYNLYTEKWSSTDAVKAIMAMSIIFMFFHLTAKGIRNTPELVATLVFGIISAILVLFFKEVKHSAYFHIFTNSFAMMKVMGS